MQELQDIQINQKKAIKKLVNLGMYSQRTAYRYFQEYRDAQTEKIDIKSIISLKDFCLFHQFDFKAFHDLFNPQKKQVA